MMKKTLLLLTGPTASGKSDIAFELAQQLNTHILSADSRQIYRELKIGVARPPEKYLQNVPHHFVASHSMFNPVSAGQYAGECRTLMEKLFQENDILILTGGSGLYIHAVIYDLPSRPEVNPRTRKYYNALRMEKGTDYLKELLQKKSPLWFQSVDYQNPARVQRALEILHDNPHAVPEKLKKISTLPCHLLTVVISEDREILYEKINQRVDRMIQEGLRNEALQWKEYKHLQVLKTVGYKEWYDHEDQSEERIAELIKQHTRRYAKRQLTWFRHQLPNAVWIKPSEKDKILNLL